MNVIYDISPVGNRPEARTGLARTAWSTAMALRQQLGDHLSFCASGSVAAALQTEDLLSHQPDLPSALNLIPPFLRRLYRLHTWLAAASAPYPFSPSALRKLATTLTTGALQVANRLRAPVNQHLLRHADIYHSSYARIPSQVRRELPRRHVLSVYDLTPLLLDEKHFVPGQRAITRRIIDGIGREDWAITISESTRTDLCNHRAVDPSRVIAIPLAASPDLFYPIADTELQAAVRAKYAIPHGDYLLTLHSLAPTKNVPHLVRSFVQLLHQERPKDVSLVIAGGSNAGAKALLTELQSAGIDTRHLHFTGFVADADLAALYSGAVAFVFPSLYEGFGLPVLEAMQCGCPVITSTTSSLPEVVGNAGLLVKPTDEDELAATLQRVLTDATLRDSLKVAGLQRAAQFSWAITARRTIEVYQTILDAV